MGQTNALEASRFIWRAVRSRYRDHRAEISAIRRHIKSADIVCDVGANKGSFLFWLARWCNQGRVVAFEPQQDLASYLARMCKSFGFDNVAIEPKAVFSQPGEQEFFIPEGHSPGASLCRGGLPLTEIRTAIVPVVSLDSYFAENERVSILKIDVEGAEVGVFEGADRILRQDMPLLIFECESRHLGERRIGDVFRHLEKIGYRGSFVYRGETLPISQFREETHQRREGEWFWKNPGYCSNFVFSKS